jgi:hypothetical protein
MAEQRSAPRYAADWVARYRFNRRRAWKDCHIVDLSRHGAALELHGVDPKRVLEEPRLYLQIQSILGVGPGAPIVADIRHCNLNGRGRAVVGVEFADLPAEQFRLLGLMVGLRSA